MKLPTRFILAAVVLAGLGYAGYHWYSGKPTDNSVSAAEGENIVTAERRDIESSLLLTGEVTPSLQIDVKPEVGGKIKKIHVAIGDTVARGDMLATIDDRDLQTERAGALTEIEGAKLAVDKTRGNYERAKALYQQKLISKEVFSNLESDFAIAENSLEKAQRRLQTVDDKLRKTVITAPFDGTVLDIPDSVNEGQVVTAAASVNSGTTMMKFASLSRLMIDSHVNQADAPSLAVGQKVDIAVVDGMTGSLTARIESIAPLATVKNNVKGFKVEAEIDQGVGRLKPGMSVSMIVPIGKVANAVSVPVTAVFRDRRDNIVYVRRGATTERRKVTIGLTDFSFAEVKSGLKEGEEILIEEPAKLPAKS